MARCTTSLRPQRELSNPPFLCLHERLAGRERENESANVVINAALAMHGILTSPPLILLSALHNRQPDLLWLKVGLHCGWLLTPANESDVFGFLMDSFFVLPLFQPPLSS